ncbi:hypothetical protein PI126_g24280 [Phytophthora idaei]|nr:hypothetical protein PI126_g24280 [Phytophthora idaei]
MSPSPADSAQDLDYAFAMDATSTTTARINKFDGTNFHTWKFKMQMVLEERELWEVTSGGSEAGALHDRGGSSALPEEVSQGAGDHLSRDGGFAAAAGPVGEWPA